MITVADIIALPAFRSAKVVSGQPDALARQVWNVGIMDEPPAVDKYSNYLPGEFVLTNMGFARDDAALGERALALMLSRDLAAVAMRDSAALRDTLAFPLSHELAKASKRSGTPLIVYDGDYHEQVIFQALKLLERDKTDSDAARMIDGLLADRPPEDIRDVFYQATGATGATIQCAVLQPSAGDEASLYAQIDGLNQVVDAIKRDWERVETAQVFRYHDCAVIIVTYFRPPAAFSLQSDSEFIQLLQPHGSFVCGISEEVPLGAGDLAVREAFGALEQARGSGSQIMRWAGLGIGAFRLAAQGDRLFANTSAIYKQMLADYDAAHDSELLASAAAVADACGDVRRAAEALFQHPNTVRYRLRKIREVLNLQSATDKQLVRFLMLVFLA